MGSSNAPHVMTLVNSIIGVSILAMPFCYRQCGILLASLILIFSNLMTRLSCHYLLKSAIMTRRKTFELLAFHAFGTSGKTAVELSIIFLMVGTCIAFFVVMGDLGPAIIGSLLQMEHSLSLRPTVLIALAVFVVLPLGLLRNVDSLSTICMLSFLFYVFLVLKVFIECTDNLFHGSWIEEVHFWRPSGIMKCLQIFSMALSCQTQLLDIFDSVPNCTLERMNSIVKSAVNLCTALYIGVGFFGYVAYYKQALSGNLLMNFMESYVSEFIKLGFVLSVAVTFPMVIFPCRTSLYSLLFKKTHTAQYALVTGGGNYIPEAQFKCLTLFIITASLTVGLLAPNIEVVVGLLGSTMGVVICFLCPPFIFIWISSKATTEKVLAQMLCAFGFFIMIMGTYTNLYLNETTNNVDVQSWKTAGSQDAKLIGEPHVNPAVRQQQIANLNDLHNEKSVILPESSSQQQSGKKKTLDIKSSMNVKQESQMPKKEEKRVEPPEPIAPEIPKIDSVKVVPEVSNKEEKKLSDFSVPNKPDLVKISKNVSTKVENNRKQLISDQKKVLQKIRQQNREKLMNDAKSAPSPKVDSPKKVKKDEDPKMVIEKTETILKPNSISNDVPKIVQNKPPLPLLMNANASKEKSEIKAVQRDILENAAAYPEREKRDLDFVSGALSKNDEIVFSEKEDTINKLTEIKEMLVPNDHKNNVEFVRNVAHETNKDATCEKKKKDMKSDSKIPLDKIQNDFVSDNVIVKAASQTPEVSKNGIQTTSDELNHVGSTSRKPLLLQEEEPTEVLNYFSNAKVPKTVSSTQVLTSLENSKIQTIQSTKNSVMNLENKDILILAPAKLSAPSDALSENLPIKSNSKPAVINAVRPMSRELKMIKHKRENGNKK